MVLSLNLGLVQCEYVIAERLRTFETEISDLVIIIRSHKFWSRVLEAFYEEVRPNGIRARVLK